MSAILFPFPPDGFKRESFELLSELLQAVRARNNNLPFLYYFVLQETILSTFTFYNKS